MDGKQVYTLLSIINFKARKPFIIVSLLMRRPKFCTNYILKNIRRIVIYRGICHKVKDYFQSVLSTLKSLFTFFWFVSCKTSQNITFHYYLHEVNGCEASCFMLRSFSYHLMKQLHGCKNQWSSWKKNLKGLKDKVCGLYWKTSICIPSSETQKY